MSIRIKPFESADLNRIEDLIALYEQLGYPSTKEELTKRLQDISKHNDYTLLLLFANERIIGFVGLCEMLFFEKTVNTCVF